MKWASCISAGNEYLSNYAKQYNSNVFVNPTTIDTLNHHNLSLFNRIENEKTIIGWTGTHTTAKYLDFLIPIFEKLSLEFEFVFRVISNEEPAMCYDNLQFIKWNKSTEIEDLLKFDIGVMPLSDDKWAKGKCGFKILQYMSLGIPAIASPVGMNSEIIDQGVNGFLCSSEDEWYKSLQFLLSDKINRINIRAAAIKKIQDNYSVKSNSMNFLSILEN